LAHIETITEQAPVY